MFVLMMVVFLMWSRDDRAAVSGHGFFERARQANLATLVASHQPAASGARLVTAAAEAGAGQPVADGRGSIDDDEHLAAYNAYLARLNQHPSGGTK